MRYMKWFMKAILAGAIAIAALSIIMCFYSIEPIHIENINGNTDYVFLPNSHWVNFVEGISWGKYDAGGYNNVSVVNNPDVMILGSSHIHAREVMQDENAGYLLSQKLDGKYSVYNMGMPGHDFYKVCQYLPNSLELYDKAPKITVIETSTVTVSQDHVDGVMQGTVEYTPSHNAGIIGILQRIPFLRRVYWQIDGGLLDLFMPEKNAVAIKTDDEGDTENEMPDQAAYDEIFAYLASMEDLYGTSIVI